MSEEFLIKDEDPSVEKARQIQADLRHLFARRARDVLDRLDQAKDTDIVDRKKLLRHYFELYNAIDTIDVSIEKFVSSPGSWDLLNIFDRKSLNEIAP